MKIREAHSGVGRKWKSDRTKKTLNSRYTQLELNITWENTLTYSRMETVDFLLEIGADFSNYNHQAVYNTIHNNEVNTIMKSITAQRI